MIRYIRCNLRSLEFEDKILPPDVEIEWDNGYYIQSEFKNGIRGEGLQTSDNKYAEKMELCRKISDALFELKELIEKENDEKC